MMNSYSAIAVIPSSNFKWTAEVQYKESLETRDAAILYASRHGCNMIVKYDRRTGPLFDVMHDPNLGTASGANTEMVKTAEVVPAIIETERIGWTKLMFRGMVGLAQKLGAVEVYSAPKRTRTAVQRQAAPAN